MGEDIETTRKFFTYFLLFFPTVIIAAIPSTEILYIIIKVLLAFYQFVALKNFIDRHYQ